MSRKKIALIVPTYNAGPLWIDWLSAFNSQSCENVTLLVIDSSSIDDTVLLARNSGARLEVISSKEFNHGGTRNRASSIMDDFDVFVFMTQDAIFENSNSLELLIDCLDDDSVSAAYGRQLPHDCANPLAQHARYFNYPSQSHVRSVRDIAEYGIKVAFMSNSFAAYRANTFKLLGCFPENTILAEDMFLAAKMILSGYKISYCAEATVRHSHNYTPWDEFRRYFDIGVFHACEPWIQESLGGASGEGFRFLMSELKYLLHHAPLWIPRALLATVCKLAGYKLGVKYQKIPEFWRPKFSMYKSYWLQQK